MKDKRDRYLVACWYDYDADRVAVLEESHHPTQLDQKVVVGYIAL